ncbi:hypothetical protein QFC19_009299 [Naganishia cerealis]|uniref:Uncharacterized protein n=1 Tax=Naganishia cerealis TaxID=610337 RepID=A0ACC2UVX7_9TREE|nr:hypothetical protein QFC19_009299 [Naganishia cerealis]
MSDPAPAITKKKPIKKIRPARKQVAVDQIDKSESVQTGKEYNVLPDTALDCFGREKHADYRDDMGGVGSFGRQNRTLYVGRMREGATKADTEEIVRRHFGEWGEIVKLNILHNRGVAFVTYANELQAQFAREAMANQSMDGDEILNVRWATEDPNPRSIVDERHRLEELGTQGITSKIDVHADLVEAVQAVKSLEEGNVDELYPIPDPEQQAEEEPPAKRMRRLENVAASAQQPAGGALFGADALENIKYFADLARQQRQQQQEGAANGMAEGKGKPSASALVGGYGSDSDADE